jgi:hypothetical protein
MGDLLLPPLDLLLPPLALGELLLHEGRVVAVVEGDGLVVHVEDVGRDAVEELVVVRDDDHGARVLRRNFSSQRMEMMSRWLVGSSRRRTSGALPRAPARAARAA